MRLQEILDKWTRGDRLTDAEIQFAFNRLETICAVIVDLPESFSLFRKELFCMRASVQAAYELMAKEKVRQG